MSDKIIQPRNTFKKPKIAPVRSFAEAGQIPCPKPKDHSQSRLLIFNPYSVRWPHGTGWEADDRQSDEKTVVGC